MLRELSINSSDVILFSEIVGNPVQIQEWTLNALPQDSFSIDNAIIMSQSERWPLMIDPQLQANIWIKNMEAKNNLTVIKPTMDVKKMSQKLENSIPFGYPVILEDAGETFDPLLDPLLGKQVEKRGSTATIRVGDASVDFASEFKFYITTKLSRPHYAPEVCVKVTMLNFMVTPEGLEDQMLSLVVRHEDPDKSKKRDFFIQERAKFDRTIAELQDKILNLIANTQGDILEDDELIIVLNNSKDTQNQIDQSKRDQETIFKQIDAMRELLTPVAVRVSRLFFVLADLQYVDPMYQYSLNFFTKIFQTAMEAVEGRFEKNDKISRRQFFIDKFTRLLYKNVCRSLFEKDKLLFSFLMCLKIMEEKDELDKVESRFLMTGATSIEMDRPNPAGDGGWLSNKAWASIMEMARVLKGFHGFDIEFEKNLDGWEKVYNSAIPHKPHKEAWPGTWGEISLLRRIIVLRIIRPDRVISSIQHLIKHTKELGKKFITPPPFDLEKAYQDSTNKMPIIFVLSPGADPMKVLEKLAEKKQVKPRPLSLGQGQAEKAKNAIAYA